MMLSPLQLTKLFNEINVPLEGPIKQYVRCSHPTKKNIPCKWDLTKGPCLTHSLDEETLSSRNAKVFQARVAKLQQKKGISYKKAKLQVMNKVAEAGAAYRKQNPSEPEKRMMAMLDRLGITYQQEWRPLEDRLLTVDFVDHSHKICYEVTSFQKTWINALGRDKAIREKRSIVAKLGYRLILVRFK